MSRRKARKPETLAERVRRLREALPGSPSPELLVQQRTAGISSQALRKVEAGKVENPRLDTLVALMQVFELGEWEELLGPVG